LLIKVLNEEIKSENTGLKKVNQELRRELYGFKWCKSSKSEISKPKKRGPPFGHKGTITIPSVICKKYGLNEGAGLEFVGSELGIVLVPIKPLKESFGIEGDIMREIAKEIGKDRERKDS